MYNEQPDILNLLNQLQESTTEDVDEERGSFKKGDTVTYNMLGCGLTDADLIRTLGADEHTMRANHDGVPAEIVEAIGEEVARYSIMFEDGFVINDVATSELKSKTNEAEEATQTMKPQEKPNINAEDYGMEDYSEEDFNKPEAEVKSKSEKTGDAIRQVEDDELEQEPDKVVEPKKESKLKEQTEGISCPRCSSTDTWKVEDDTYECEECGARWDEETGEILRESKGNEGQEDTIISAYKKARSDGKSREEATQIASKASKGQADSVAVRKLLAVKGIRDSRFSFVKKQKPLWLCNECFKTFRSDKNLCESCKSENVEKITEQYGAGFTKEVYQVTWKNTDTGKEESTRVMAFDDDDAKREAKRPNREITKVEGPIMEEPRRESTAPFDENSEGANDYETWLKTTKLRDLAVPPKFVYDKVTRLSEEGKTPGVIAIMLQITKNTILSILGKENESKLKEGVQELVREVPGIDKEEQEILLKAIKDGTISNEWPSEENMVKAFMDAEIDPAIADDADIEDFRLVYLKHILLTKAMKATRVAKESKLKEQEEDWDLTFQYEHNLIWHNPIRDKEGIPVFWQQRPKAGTKIRVFTDYQAEWVERNKGIPVMAEFVGESIEEKETKPSVTIEIVKSTVDPDAWIFRAVELPSGDSVNLSTSEGSEKEALKKGKEIARSLGAEFLGFVDEKKVEEQEDRPTLKQQQDVMARLQYGKGWYKDLSPEEKKEVDSKLEGYKESKLKEQEENIFKMSDEELEKLPLHVLGRAREDAWRNYRLGSGSKEGLDWKEGWRRLDGIIKKMMDESKLKEQEEELKSFRVWYKDPSQARLVKMKYEFRADTSQEAEEAARMLLDKEAPGNEFEIAKSELIGDSKLKEQEEDTFRTVVKGIVAKTLADEIAAKEKGIVVKDEDDDEKFMIIVKDE